MVIGLHLTGQPVAAVGSAMEATGMLVAVLFGIQVFKPWAAL